jgi:hypothetical protein
MSNFNFPLEIIRLDICGRDVSAAIMRATCMVNDHVVEIFNIDHLISAGIKIERHQRIKGRAPG